MYFVEIMRVHFHYSSAHRMPALGNYFGMNSEFNSKGVIFLPSKISTPRPKLIMAFMEIVNIYNKDTPEKRRETMRYISNVIVY